MEIVITTINTKGGITVKNKRYELTNETHRCYVSNEKLFRKKDFLTPYSKLINHVTREHGFITFSIKYLDKDSKEAMNILTEHFKKYLTNVISNLSDLKESLKILETNF